MTRKTIVSLLHDFLRTELGEPDEIDATPAYVLQDLFDCRVCAGHIIQVYIKGIMEGITLPDGSMIFDAEKPVSGEELADILTKACFPEFRTPKRPETEIKPAAVEPKEVSFEQAMNLVSGESNILLVDVRSEREYEEAHLPGAVNAPFLSVIKNPFMFSEKRDIMILLYCNEGYQSKAAAQCLLETGYKNVVFFAWSGEK